MRLCANFTHKAHDSVFTRCTFWHRPDGSRARYESRVVWWVISLAVVVVVACFVLAVVAIAGLVRFFVHLKKRQKQVLTTCLFQIDRGNVHFTSHGSVLPTSTQTVIFEDRLPVDSESRELVSIGNNGRDKLKVQLLVNNRNFEKAAFRVFPETVVLEKGMVCEFEVYVTPHCTCTLEDEQSVSTKKN